MTCAHFLIEPVPDEIEIDELQSQGKPVSASEPQADKP
jgi:hypothetical protein